MASDPRDEVCPECGKTVREHIDEGKRYMAKILERSERLKAQTLREGQ